MKLVPRPTPEDVRVLVLTVLRRLGQFEALLRTQHPEVAGAPMRELTRTAREELLRVQEETCQLVQRLQSGPEDADRLEDKLTRTVVHLTEAAETFRELHDEVQRRGAAAPAPILVEVINFPPRQSRAIEGAGDEASVSALSALLT